MYKKMFLFLALLATVSAAAALSWGAVIGPNDVPAGYVAYIKTTSDQFPERGEVIFVKSGLNPKVPDFVLATDYAPVAGAAKDAGMDVNAYVKSIIMKSTDEDLTALAVEKTGEIVGYAWGPGFLYNAEFNEITYPAPPNLGRDSQGGVEK